MRISQLSLAGRGAWPDLYVDHLKAGLNVFYAPPRAGKSTVAQLVGQLLYGKTDSLWRRHFGQTVPHAEGSISVDSDQGRFILRRHQGSSGEKLTIASSGGQSVDGRTVRSLLKKLSPDLAAKLYAVDCAESPAVEWLLSEDFSRKYTATREAASAEFTAGQGYSKQPELREIAGRIDRRRVDELVARRNQIAREIEQQLSVERREDAVLQQELTNLDEALVSKRKQLQTVREKLYAVETQLAEVETRLRYTSLENCVTRETTIPQQEPTAQKLHELDAEITRCRQAIAECQTREVAVRTELAQLNPDGTADAVTCLADGRTTLTVMERLLDDLDAEVAQLARATEPGRGMDANVHAKISPVAELLRQQIYTLCGQLSEQERANQRQQALVESRQLNRTQLDLSERLEHLLSCREALVQKSQRIGQPIVLSPQQPASDHCRCDRHDQFVVKSGRRTSRTDSGHKQESTAFRERSDLEQRRVEFVNELTRLQREVEQLESRWKDLQRQRGGLLGSASIENRRAELNRLETIIQQSLHATVESRATTPSAVWRASDVLAQLTDGDLVQLRLEERGERARIIDRAGRSLRVESLSPAQHDALYLALTLALVASNARRGIELPLVLDEFFLRQDPAGAAIMAGVLTEFARAGHQLLVFTEDRDAQRRFTTLGETVFDLESLRRKSVVPASSVKEHPTQATPLEAGRSTRRVTRETTDGYQSPALRLAPVSGETSDADSYYLFETSSLAEFPVLGSDTTDAFSRISIESVADLLSADTTDVTQRLQRDKITPETVKLWQKHMALMCFVPDVSLNDARLLTASGIPTPGHLMDADADELLRAIDRTLESDRGRRFTAGLHHRFTREQLDTWIRGACRNRKRWNDSQSRYAWTRTGSRSHNSRAASPPEQQAKKRRFYLQRDSDVEAAPSIGPKTAARLHEVGIRTVADLLNADAESTAEELDISHITSTRIAAWQHQARLICRIPELHGYGAQLLVACGFTEPEQISGADPDDTATRISKFCKTKKGQRILRNGDAPNRETIEEWIESAGRVRPLEAA